MKHYLDDKDFWKTREPFEEARTLLFKGFCGHVLNLLNEGWIIEKVTKKLGKNTFIYAFHPEFNIVARGNYTERPIDIHMDFITHCKNIRFSKSRAVGGRVLDSDPVEYVAESSIKELTIEQHLQAIINIQDKTKPVKRIKVSDQATILNFIGKVA